MLGLFDLGVIITLRKDGYAPYALGGYTDESFGQGGGSFFRDEQVVAMAGHLGVPYPWTNGVVALAAFPQREGAKFVAVSPGAGPAFYYNAATQLYSTDLEGTTAQPASADFPLGEGGFLDVTPGEFEIEYRGNVVGCTRGSFGWEGTAPNWIRVPVLAGHITWASMKCEVGN